MTLEHNPTENARPSAVDAMTISTTGSGATILLLHGGGGPGSVAGFATALSNHAEVIAPTHPGFAGTGRTDLVESIADLAAHYIDLIARRDKRDVLVVGLSIGGWIACEMAALGSDRIGGLLLVDTVGAQFPGETVLDVFSIPREELARYSYHRPEAFRMNPAAMAIEQREAMAANFAALDFYGGALKMQDPALADKLATIAVPVSVVWGESDGVASPSYGRAFAAAIPDATFELIPECGHFPQFEQPQRLIDLTLAQLDKVSAKIALR